MPLERWEPDHNLVASVLSTPKSTKRMTDLSGPDRSWLVAGLTLSGMTAKAIADRLSCSLRLVRTIRSEEMTQVCHWSQKREAALVDEVRKTKLEYRLMRRSLEQAEYAKQRMRAQLDQVLDAHLMGTLTLFPRCGHPKVPYNVYRYVDRSGPSPRTREACRECNRDRVAKHREKRKDC